MTHWEQTYTLSSRAENWVCAGCGCLVHDRATHDQWHRVTRSVVGNPEPKPPVADAEWARGLGFTVTDP